MRDRVHRHEDGYVVIKDAALQRGCDVCRDHVAMLLEDAPPKIDFLCPKCSFHWKITRGTTGENG